MVDVSVAALASWLVAPTRYKSVDLFCWATRTIGHYLRQEQSQPPVFVMVAVSSYSGLCLAASWQWGSSEPARYPLGRCPGAAMLC